MRGMCSGSRWPCVGGKCEIMCVCVCVCMTEVSQGPAALRLCGWIELWVSGFNLCPKCHTHTEDGKRRRWNGRPWDQHLTEISAWFLWRKKKKSFWVWITHNNKEITMPPTHVIGWVQNHTLRKKIQSCHWSGAFLNSASLYPYYSQRLHIISALKNSTPTNVNLRKMYQSSGHLRCRWVWFFIRADLEKFSSTLLHHLLSYRSSAVNGCRQNDSPNSW